MVAMVAIIATLGLYQLGQKTQTYDDDKDVVTLYKSPTCGCCTLYTTYLEDAGYKVKVVKTNDMDAIKNKYNIPKSMESCHTVVMGDYFIEGHIPIEGINYLLEQNPDIDGIALPGMPIGSPGMPGIKQEPFEIFALDNGSATHLMNL